MAGLRVACTNPTRDAVHHLPSVGFEGVGRTPLSLLFLDHQPANIPLCFFQAHQSSLPVVKSLSGSYQQASVCSDAATAAIQ